uniref:M15 family metallopeptidase n=1 Tax=Roseivirga sp. TaxID=1964215 RepID=UPI0040477202
MAYQFGLISKQRSEGVHPYLLLCCERVMLCFDITVMWRGGVRTDAQQAELYAIGRTTELDRKPVTTKDGIIKKSKHQKQTDGFAHAIDISPFPLQLDDSLKAKARYYQLNGHMQQAWQQLKDEGKVIGRLRWGGDWDGDNDYKDQSFDDIPHFEWDR